MYQVCPICKGSGVENSLIYNKCRVCKGKRIISTVTGLPPKEENNND